MPKKILEYISFHGNTLAIAGLNKNAGKTVSLIYIISEMSKTNRIIGTTSIGFDGERKDMIFGHEKPAFTVVEGTYIATASTSLNNYRGDYEVVENTNLHSPLGEIYIIKARSNSALELVGPSSIEGLQKVKECLLKYTDFVLIDGAYNRITQISPNICDMAILAVGGESLAKSIKEMQRIVRLSGLPIYEKQDLEEVFKSGKCAIISNQNTVAVDSGEIGMYSGDYLVWNGALTDNTASLVAKKYQGIIIEDLTKIFLTKQMLDKLVINKKLYVYKRIEILMCTYNPLNFKGQDRSSYEFGSKISAAFPSLIFCDVSSSYCFKGGAIDGYLG